jgi:hypothetical protein
MDEPVRRLALALVGAVALTAERQTSWRTRSRTRRDEPRRGPRLDRRVDDALARRRGACGGEGGRDVERRPARARPRHARRVGRARAPRPPSSSIRLRSRRDTPQTLRSVPLRTSPFQSQNGARHEMGPVRTWPHGTAALTLGLCRRGSSAARSSWCRRVATVGPSGSPLRLTAEFTNRVTSSAASCLPGGGPGSGAHFALAFGLASLALHACSLRRRRRAWQLAVALVSASRSRTRQGTRRRGGDARLAPARRAVRFRSASTSRRPELGAPAARHCAALAALAHSSPSRVRGFEATAGGLLVASRSC